MKLLTNEVIALTLDPWQTYCIVFIHFYNS